MGQDRLKEQKDRAKRGWNEAADRFAQPSLFDRDAILAGRTFPAALRNGNSCAIGEKLLLHFTDDGPVVTQGPAVIADCKNLPAEIAEALKQNSRVICVEVVNINPLSETLEVTPK